MAQREKRLTQLTESNKVKEESIGLSCLGNGSMHPKTSFIIGCVCS